MSPGEMEIQLSSMSQQECTYQAIVTVVILVSMIHNLYSHVHVFVSHGTSTAIVGCLVSVIF